MKKMKKIHTLFSDCCYLKEILAGFISLLRGMRVTWRAMCSRPHTVQWPRETAPLPARFRGHIELVADPATGRPRCIVCGGCARACPSGCIVVRGEKTADSKKKTLTEFTLNFTTCSLCGLCVESCPVNAITFSRDYALAGVNDEIFSRMNLLADMKNTAGGMAHV